MKFNNPVFKIFMVIIGFLIVGIFAYYDNPRIEKPEKMKSESSVPSVPQHFPEPAPAPGTEQNQPTIDDLKMIAKIDNLNKLVYDLKEKNPHTRKKAAQALTIIGTPSVEPLILALKDKDSTMRQWAAITLGMIKDSRSVEPLITALKDADLEVQMGVAYALGEIKDVRAIEPLITITPCGLCRSSDVRRAVGGKDL